jgi:hypothetical protein
MSKGMDIRRQKAKKEPTRSLKEKRAEKKAKRESKSFTLPAGLPAKES